MGVQPPTLGPEWMGGEESPGRQPRSPSFPGGARWAGSACGALGGGAALQPPGPGTDEAGGLAWGGGAQWWWLNLVERPQAGRGPGAGGGWEQSIRAFFFLSAINLSGSCVGSSQGSGDPAVQATGSCPLRGTTAGEVGARAGRGRGGATPVGATLHTFSNKPELGPPSACSALAPVPGAGGGGRFWAQGGGQGARGPGLRCLLGSVPEATHTVRPTRSHATVLASRGGERSEGPPASARGSQGGDAALGLTGHSLPGHLWLRESRAPACLCWPWPSWWGCPGAQASAAGALGAGSAGGAARGLWAIGASPFRRRESHPWGETSAPALLACTGG